MCWPLAAVVGSHLYKSCELRKSNMHVCMRLPLHLDVDTFRPPGLACLSSAVMVGLARGIAMSMTRTFNLEVSTYNVGDGEFFSYRDGLGILEASACRSSCSWIRLRLCLDLNGPDQRCTMVLRYLSSFQCSPELQVTVACSDATRSLYVHGYGLDQTPERGP